MLQSSGPAKKKQNLYKSCYISAHLAQKGVSACHALNAKTILGENNKSRSSTFRNILFSSNYNIFWLSYESFSILYDAFC